MEEVEVIWYLVWRELARQLVSGIVETDFRMQFFLSR